MPTTASPNRPLHPRRSRVCYVFLVILTLIFIIAVGFLITWLVTKPKKLHYSLENASVQNFNLTDDNHMSATFKLTIQSHNPNHRISVYYNSVEIYVKFKDQTLAFDTMEPFHQPRMNVTQIDDTLVAQNVAVSKSSGKDLRDQHSLGKIELEVYVKAKVRFKVAVWKSSHRTAHIKCSHATVYLSQSNKSLNSSCEADVWLASLYCHINNLLALLQTCTKKIYIVLTDNKTKQKKKRITDLRGSSMGHWLYMFTSKKTNFSIDASD